MKGNVAPANGEARKLCPTSPHSRTVRLNITSTVRRAPTYGGHKQLRHRKIQNSAYYTQLTVANLSPGLCHMSRRGRSINTAVSLGRILAFPVRTDPTGQIELFPEPPAPDPYSAAQLIIRLSLLHMRITRIASGLSPSERLDLFGQCDLLEPIVERYEEVVALRRQREAHSVIARIA